MNVSSKKIISSLIAAGLLALSVPSIAGSFIPDKQAWEQRSIDLKKKHANDYVIGLFPGSAQINGSMDSISRFIFLINYLTENTDDLYSYVQVSKSSDMRKDINEKKHKILYVSPDLAVTAIQKGYIPIAQRSVGISAAMVVAKDSAFKKLSDLNGKNMISIRHSMMDSVARDYLEHKKMTFSEKSSDSIESQKFVAEAVLAKKADFGVIRKDLAEDMISKGAKIRIVSVAPEMPGFMFLVSPDTPDGSVQKLKKAVLAMDTSAQANVLNNLETGKLLTAGFKPYDESSMANVTRLVKKMADSKKTK